MSDVHLAAVDLNLLVALRALLDEQHVGRAAVRVGLSQSAMSHALGRLREVFEDPLFVRCGGRMQPTTRAAMIRPRLEQCLQEAERIVFETPTFDPQASTRVFRIASEDYFSAVLLPSLLASVRRAAPYVSVEVVRSAEDPFRQLHHADIDLLIGMFEAHADARRQVLFREQTACLVSRTHPHVRRRPSLDRYARTPHLVVSVGRRSPTIIDRRLAEQGLERWVALRVDNFLAAPLAVAASDLLFTCPRRLADTYSEAPNLRVVPLPSDLGTISAEYAMLWSPARHDDPGHMWLRTKMAEAASEA